MKIITVQHTQSEQHVNGMIGSWYNWSLTDLGKETAHRIGKKLSQELDEDYIVYSSDLLRARQTAEIIANYLNTSPILSDKLREFNLGQAIGQSKEWARSNSPSKLWPDMVDWPEDIDAKAFGDGESKRDVWLRLENFLAELLSSDHEKVIIVAHDGSLSLLFSLWLGLEANSLRRSSLSGKSGGVSFLRQDQEGHRIIERLNDMSYSQDL